MWKEKTATRIAESRQKELMPAANWISGQRGGRVVNVTPGVRQMFAGNDGPLAGLHLRLFLHRFGHCSSVCCLDQLHVFDTVSKGLQFFSD